MTDIIKYLRDNFGITFNAQQKAALFAAEGKYLLIAVPGAGKTTVLVSRLAELILNHSANEKRILTVTFNRESARDMKRRFVKLFGSICRAPDFSTIHSFCFNVLKRYSKVYNREMPKVLDDGQKSAVLRKICRNEGLFLQEDELDEVNLGISFVKNKLYSEDEIKAYDISVNAFYDIYRSYEQFKRENKLMDFDDMLIFTLSILKKLPSMLDEVRQSYDYINVDEAQDTSLLQHEIIKLIVTDRHNLFMVGDEDQSIYSFRGAQPSELLNFTEIYPDAVILKMEENFRSTPQIVQYANEKISENKDRFKKNMYTHNPKGKKVKHTVLNDANEQYDYIISKIKKLPKNKTAAVIYRTNDCAVALIDALKRNGIGFYIRDHKNRFLSNAVVADILAFIRLAEKPDDIEAFKRVCFKTDAMVSRDMLDYVCGAAVPGENLYDVLLSCDKLDGSSCDLIDGIREETKRFYTKKPLDVLKEIEYAFGYRNFLKWKYSDGYYLEMMLQKLTVLKSLAYSCADMDEFIEKVHELSGDIQGFSDSESNVTLTTVHSAKGLEFDYVFLIDLIEGFFPSAQSIEMHLKGDDSLLEEERRLFYVAVTRAKSELEVITALRINGEFYSASRFVQKKEEEKPKNKVFGGGIGIGIKRPQKQKIKKS